MPYILNDWLLSDLPNVPVADMSLHEGGVTNRCPLQMSSFYKELHVIVSVG